jgi:hypothetical protein
MALQPIIELLQGSEMGGGWGLLIDFALAIFQILQWFIELITVVGVF